MKVQNQLAIALLIIALAYGVLLDYYIVVEYHMKWSQLKTWDLVLTLCPIALLLFNAAILFLIDDQVLVNDTDGDLSSLPIKDCSPYSSTKYPFL